MQRMPSRRSCLPSSSAASCYLFVVLHIKNPIIGITLIAQPVCHNIVWLQAYKSQKCSACPAEETSCLPSSSAASCLAVAVLLLAILVYSCKATQRCKLLSTTALYSSSSGLGLFRGRVLQPMLSPHFQATISYTQHNNSPLVCSYVGLPGKEKQYSCQSPAMLQYTTRASSIVGGPGS